MSDNNMVHLLTRSDNHYIEFTHKVFRFLSYEARAGVGELIKDKHQKLFKHRQNRHPNLKSEGSEFDPPLREKL